MSDEIQLPELPEPDGEIEVAMAGRLVPIDVYRPSTVRDYARAAVLADRERRAQQAPGQPSAEPVAWITNESLRSLSRGGNSAGSVPVHASRSYVAKTPVYIHPSPADEAVRRDAERYRWLRKGAVEDVAVVRGLGAMDYGMSAVVSTYSEEIDGDDLDAAIDAALAKENIND